MATKRSSTTTAASPAAICTLLIDGDILAYEFSNRGQRVYQWDDETAGVALDDIEDVVSIIPPRVEKLMERLEADQAIFCLTPSPDVNNFRKKILPTYKAGRPVKPLLLPQVREWIQKSYRTYLKDGIEADDTMGILSTHPKLIPGRKIIVSEDKDLRTIPGELYVPRLDELMTITPAAADYNHLYQTLVGDTTDNYKGCPGIGPVKAAELLDSLWGESDSGRFFPAALVWPHVVGMFKSKGFTEADALVQAQVARILRHNEYDFKRKEPILWQPPTP